MTYFNIAFAKEKMKELKISTRMLASSCNTSPATISRLLNGEINDPKVSLLSVISKTLNISIDDLIESDNSEIIVVKGKGKNQMHTFSDIKKAIRYARNKKFDSVIIPRGLDLTANQEIILCKIQNELLNCEVD